MKDHATLCAGAFHRFAIEQDPPAGGLIKACHDAGIKAFVPKPMTSNAKAMGRFDKSDFIYIARDDEYQCPAGQRAIYRYTREENGQQIRRYWSSDCTGCTMKSQCTTADYRRISRWEHEPVIEAMQRRLDREPDAMTLRIRMLLSKPPAASQWNSEPQ